MLIRLTLLYMPAQLIGPLFQFIAAVAWTHYLSPGEYGVLAYVMAAQELAYLICLAWWSQYMLRYLGGFADAEARRRYQGAENAVLAASSVLQAGVGVATLASLHHSVGPLMIAATMVYCVSRSLTTHLAERARSAGAIGAYTLAQIIGPVAGFGLAFIAVSRYEASAEAALAAFAAAQALGLAWLWRELGLGVTVDATSRDIFRRAAKFGLPLIIAGAIGWVSFNGIRVIVEQLDGPVAVGLVSVGWGLGQRLAAVVAMLVTAAAFPIAVKHLQSGARDEALAAIANSAGILFALLAPACVGIVMISRPMVELLIAAEFQDITYAVLPLAAVAGALRNLRVHTADQAIILFEATNYNVVVNVLEAVATVTGCVVGLALHGLPGAAAGCLAGTVVGVIYGFAVPMRRFGLYLPWRHFARIAIATCVMAIVLLAIPFDRMGLALAPRIIVEMALGALVYFAALCALYPAVVRDGARRAARAFSPAS